MFSSVLGFIGTCDQEFSGNRDIATLHCLLWVITFFLLKSTYSSLRDFDLFTLLTNAMVMSGPSSVPFI